MGTRHMARVLAYTHIYITHTHGHRFRDERGRESVKKKLESANELYRVSCVLG